MIWPTFTQSLVVSAAIRGALVLYSEYHDAHATVKYTDVDYRVFTDAARFLLNSSENTRAQGILNLTIGDPYLRDTYRYTPLLALIMTPNILLHPSFGKIIFSLCDLVVGTMLYSLFCSSPPKPNTSLKIKQQATLWVSGLWLLNPMVFAISTRGSSESVLGLLVVGTLYLAMKGRSHLAAMLFGLSVHWKIYPIIYGTSILAFYGAHARNHHPHHHNDNKNNKPSKVRRTYTDWIDKRGFIFGVLSAVTFATITGVLYLIWGFPLLWNSYLYHLGRLDHRHNFSPYFYPTYLSYSNPNLNPSSNHSHNTDTNTTALPSLISNPLISFLPQMSLALGSGILLVDKPTDLPLTWFIQTLIFVTFNKVCTSQYFIWYIWFLPLIIPRLRLTAHDTTLLFGIWGGAQALWLSIAYRLEFQGEQVYFVLWLASIFFFCANCWVIVRMM